MNYTVGSLFAGVGGICLGFQNAMTEKSEYHLQWANEIDEYACETYRTNFEHLLLQGDIEKIIHPTRIDENVEKLRRQIKSVEEEKSKITSKIVKLQKEKPVDFEVEIASHKLGIEQLKKKSDDIEEQLNVLLNLRDDEFKTYMQNHQLPDWIAEQNKTDEFENYLALRKQIIANPIDVLNGGFPCQAFSIAGERYGFKDPRGNLFLSIVDLIELLGRTHTEVDADGKVLVNGKPRVLFLENVKNLKNHDNGRTYKEIKSRLEECGYTIYERVLNTMDYSDIPQNRERIYIIGFRDEEDAKEFNLFETNEIKKHKVNKDSKDRAKDVKAVIDYRLSKATSEKYYYTREKYPAYFMTEEEFQKSDKQIKINLDEQINEMYQFYQVRRGMYVRKNQSDVCPTLTANMGTGGHNVPLIKVKDGVRKITPSEAFRLQGFPVGNGYTLPTTYNDREYADSHLYKQAGNAVSVPVITLIAGEILKILERRDNTND